MSPLERTLPHTTRRFCALALCDLRVDPPAVSPAALDALPTGLPYALLDPAPSEDFARLRVFRHDLGYWFRRLGDAVWTVSELHLSHPEVHGDHLFTPWNDLVYWTAPPRPTTPRTFALDTPLLHALASGDLAEDRRWWVRFHTDRPLDTLCAAFLRALTGRHAAQDDASLRSTSLRSLESHPPFERPRTGPTDAQRALEPLLGPHPTAHLDPATQQRGSDPCALRVDCTRRPLHDEIATLDARAARFADALGFAVTCVETVWVLAPETRRPA